MGALAALLIANLPSIITAAQDVTALVNGVKAADSAYEAIKASFPQIASTIEAIGKELSALPGLSDIEHLDSIARALFGGGGWTAEQQQAWWDRASAQNDV